MRRLLNGKVSMKSLQLPASELFLAFLGITLRHKIAHKTPNYHGQNYGKEQYRIRSLRHS